MQICPVCEDRPAVYRGRLVVSEDSARFFDYPKLHKYWLERIGRYDSRKTYPFASCERCIEDDVRNSFEQCSNGFFRTLNLSGVEKLYDSYRLITVTPQLLGPEEHRNK